MYLKNLYVFGKIKKKKADRPQFPFLLLRSLAKNYNIYFKISTQPLHSQKRFSPKLRDNIIK